MAFCHVQPHVAMQANQGRKVDRQIHKIMNTSVINQEIFSDEDRDVQSLPLAALDMSGSFQGLCAPAELSSLESCNNIISFSSIDLALAPVLIHWVLIYLLSTTKLDWSWILESPRRSTNASRAVPSKWIFFIYRLS